tara:strand:- start:134 stop:373 length:240 start_codon:yes stop_codon:yes gene_type:complete
VAENEIMITKAIVSLASANAENRILVYSVFQRFQWVILVSSGIIWCSFWFDIPDARTPIFVSLLHPNSNTAPEPIRRLS